MSVVHNNGLCVCVCVCVCVLCLVSAIHEEQTRGTEKEDEAAEDGIQCSVIRTKKKTPGNANCQWMCEVKLSSMVMCFAHSGAEREAAEDCHCQPGSAAKVGEASQLSHSVLCICCS